MRIDKSKYRVAMITALISAGICIVGSIIGIIVMANLDNFTWYYNYIMFELKEDVNELFGIDGLGALIESFGLDLNEFAKSYYVSILFNGIIRTLLFVALFLLAFFGRNDDKLDDMAFRKRRKLHTWYLIVNVLVVLSTSTLDGTPKDAPYYQIAFLCDLVCETVCGIAFIVTFFMALNVVNKNKRLVRNFEEVKYYAENLRRQESNDFKADNDFNFERENRETIVTPSEVIKEEKVEEVHVDNKKLDEVYTLLAKLEKQYKNGEISEEDYQRMKKTILDNYMNN